jgi:hypothetical protein
MLEIGVPSLISIPRVELRRAASWLGLLHEGTMATHSSRSHGCDGWIDVADVRAPSPLAVSEVLRGLDGKKAEAPGPPCTILDMGSKRSLQFSSMI